MEVRYAISEKVRQNAIFDGRELDSYQTLEFEPHQLSMKARELWVQLYGSVPVATLRMPTIADAYVFNDNPPKIAEGNIFTASKILTPSDLESVLEAILAQKRKLEAELPQRVSEWEKVKADFEARKKLEAEEWEKADERERKKAEAQAKRLANLPWLKALAKKLNINGQAKSEINRFCKKFNLTPKDITIQNINYKPYVRLSITIPINVTGIERTLKIINKTYSDDAAEQDNYYKPEFSDLTQTIAKALAEIFNGEVKIVCNYNRGEAYLNVQSESDTILVAVADLASNNNK